jgi:hypothetical protein
VRVKLEEVEVYVCVQSSWAADIAAAAAAAAAAAEAQSSPIPMEKLRCNTYIQVLFPATKRKEEDGSNGKGGCEVRGSMI